MIEKILEQYTAGGGILVSVQANHSGNINNTYLVELVSPQGKHEKYTVQRINTNVFSNPWQLMANIERVSDFLKKESEKEKNSKHTVLELVKTKEGQSLCVVENDGRKEYFRIYKYIDNSIVYDNLSSPEIAFNTGKAFGNFQKLLRDYPIQTLYETIKDFHATDKRLMQFLEDCKRDLVGRVSGVKEEIDFILTRKQICSSITSVLGSRSVPLRVTHNDTKVNNVVMSTDGDFLAVIDFDTVMPGSLLYDYGDGIRSSTSTAKEDEKDLSKVSINLELFKSYTDGFMSEMAPFITQKELSLMAQSIRVITLELGIRFLDDYINGDVYFKTRYKEHNLDRARNQLKLVEDIEQKFDQMNQYIHQSYKTYSSKEANH